MEKEYKKSYYKIVHKNDHNLELVEFKDMDVTFHEFMSSPKGTHYSVVGRLDDLKLFANSLNGVVMECQEIRRILD